jgi:hypothetical protein
MPYPRKYIVQPMNSNSITDGSEFNFLNMMFKMHKRPMVKNTILKLIQETAKVDEDFAEEIFKQMSKRGDFKFHRLYKNQSVYVHKDTPPHNHDIPPELHIE